MILIEEINFFDSLLTASSTHNSVSLFLTVHLLVRKISPVRLFDTKPVTKFKNRTPYNFLQAHYKH